MDILTTEQNFQLNQAIDEIDSLAEEMFDNAELAAVLAEDVFNVR